MTQRGRPRGPDRVPFPLRAQREILEAVQRCASADLRSVNAEIEILLLEALARRGIRVRQPEQGDLDNADE